MAGERRIPRSETRLKAQPSSGLPMREHAPHPAEIYVGMPRGEWRTGCDMVRTYVLERSPKDPEVVRGAVCAALRDLRSWGDFVSGRWVLRAGTVVDAVKAPGFRMGRLYQTLERLVRWLHARGDIDEWQRDRLQHAIDEARRCHHVRRTGPSSRGLEHVPARCQLDWLADRFARSFPDPKERALAREALRRLAAELDGQLGAGEHLPFGALDVDGFVCAVHAAPARGSAGASSSLELAAAFYRWLGERGHLDPARARHQASRLAAAALTSRAWLAG